MEGNIQLHPISASFMYPGEKEKEVVSGPPILSTEIDQSVFKNSLLVQTAVTGLNRNEQEGFQFSSAEAEIGSITGSEILLNRFSILTETNLCSMIFKNENNSPALIAFSSNICELIRRCPQVRGIYCFEHFFPSFLSVYFKQNSGLFFELGKTI